MSMSKFKSVIITNFKKTSPLHKWGRTYFTYTKEPAQYLKKKTCWTSAKEALCVLNSGDQVVIHGAAATPLELVRAMTDIGKEYCLKNINIFHMHTEGPATYTDPEYEGIFRSCSFFMAGNVRKAINEGRADCMPIFLHEIPKVFYRGIVKPNVILIHVSPPDAHGFCSLGTSVDCIRAAMTHSKIIIAQVNPCMPRTFGDGIIHISHIDYAVEVNNPILGSEPQKIGPFEKAIGKHIAENLVADGATLQMGIGAIPDAVLAQLGNHKDLGIHSEMFATGVVDLFYKGVITNNKKNMHRGRIVGSFLRGDQKLYDFVDNNPVLEMLRVDYVNDCKVIAQQPKMTAINSAIEIDLTGQVVADSIGTRMFSGFGGQVDFIRGAGDSFDGKGVPIIAMTSLTKKKKSKIVPFIAQGAGVVTSRAHVQYVVTEYGIASLFGKSLRQRAYELIKIAHPDHREALTKAAFERLKCMPSK